MLSKIIDLTKNLNELCTYFDVHYSVNSGGCCFLAYCIANNCEKFNIPYKIRIYNPEYDSENLIVSSIMDGELEACYHISVIIENSEINGYENCFYFHMDIPPIKSKYIGKWYKNSDWNPIYNKKYNGVILKQINKIFKQYEKEKCN